MHRAFEQRTGHRAGALDQRPQCAGGADQEPAAIAEGNVEHPAAFVHDPLAGGGEEIDSRLEP